MTEPRHRDEPWPAHRDQRWIFPVAVFVLLIALASPVWLPVTWTWLT